MLTSIKLRRGPRGPRGLRTQLPEKQVVSSHEKVPGCKELAGDCGDCRSSDAFVCRLSTAAIKFYASTLSRQCGVVLALGIDSIRDI